MKNIAHLILIAAIACPGMLFAQANRRPANAYRRAINLPSHNPQSAFSDAVLAGNTLYIAGSIGVGPKTQKAPANLDTEITYLLDNFKAVLTQAGMSMDDLVNVQVFCSDLSLYDKFNAAYKRYFSRELPARAFIGAGSLLVGGHFEMNGIAVKR